MRMLNSPILKGLLAGDVERWNAFREPPPEEIYLRGLIAPDLQAPKADLSGADLGGAELTGANLRGANLVGSNLVGADLGYADLTGADLRRANLTGADLRCADLTGANLRGAYVPAARLEHAIIRGVDLRDAVIGAADFRGAVVSGTLCPMVGPDRIGERWAWAIDTGAGGLVVYWDGVWSEDFSAMHDWCGDVSTETHRAVAAWCVWAFGQLAAQRADGIMDGRGI